MKKLLIIIITLAAVLSFGILEQVWITKNFHEIEKKAEFLSDGAEKKTLTYEEVETVNEWWTNKKRTLHIIIPHNEIRDIDYWLSEGSGYVKNGEYELAFAQFAIMKDAAKTIPLAFRFKIENIF